MAAMRYMSLAITITVLSATIAAAEKDEAWVSLFNGKNLDGWKASKENPNCYAVTDGALIVKGGRGHLFYQGKVNGAVFKNFELKIEALTKPGANSGIYFHTQYQDKGWPFRGYEVQVNNTHKDKRKTGSLYAIKDVHAQLVPDNQWYEYHIIVKGKTITIKINGKTAVQYTEPAKLQPPKNMKGRYLDKGTFALQAHDPKSEAHFRNIRVKVLPD